MGTRKLESRFLPVSIGKIKTKISRKERKKAKYQGSKNTSRFLFVRLYRKKKRKNIKSRAGGWVPW